MAIQVINDPYRVPDTRDSTFGGALATGLGRGITRLAENKLQQLQQKNQNSHISQRLQGLGLNPNEADYLATLPAKEQTQLLSLYAKGNQQQQQPQGAQQELGEQAPQQAQPSLLQTIGKAAPVKNPAQQSRINSANKKYLDTLDKKAENAAMERSLAEEMLGLLDSGKVQSGFLGQYTPGFLLNDESQQFDALSNELATALASRGGGQVSKYRLQLAQSMKAGLRHKPQTQKKLLDRVLKEVQNVEKEDILRHQIIEENGGEQPTNIHTLVANKMKKVKNSSPITEDEFDSLPAASEYDEGSVIKDSETGTKYKVVAGQWFKEK